MKEKDCLDWKDLRVQTSIISREALYTTSGGSVREYTAVDSLMRGVFGDKIFKEPLILLNYQEHRQQYERTIRNRIDASFSSWRMLHQRTLHVLASLDTREKGVLEALFGLMDGRQRSIRQVAKELDIPKSTVWDAKTRALSRLRSGRRQALDEYLAPIPPEELALCVN